MRRFFNKDEAELVGSALARAITDMDFCLCIGRIEGDLPPDHPNPAIPQKLLTIYMEAVSRVAAITRCLDDARKWGELDE